MVLIFTGLKVQTSRRYAIRPSPVCIVWWKTSPYCWKVYALLNIFPYILFVWWNCRWYVQVSDSGSPDASHRVARRRCFVSWKGYQVCTRSAVETPTTQLIVITNLWLVVVEHRLSRESFRFVTNIFQIHFQRRIHIYIQCRIKWLPLYN